MKTSTKIITLRSAAVVAITTSIVLSAKQRNGAAAVTALTAKALMLKASWVRDEDIIARTSASAVAIANMDIEKIIANAVAATRSV